MFSIYVAFFFCRTGMAGVPGTANAIFGAVKDVGANVIMISQVLVSSDFSLMVLSVCLYAKGKINVG